MQVYYALLVPGGLALFAAVVGIIAVVVERWERAQTVHSEKFREDLREQIARRRQERAQAILERLAQQLGLPEGRGATPKGAKLATPEK